MPADGGWRLRGASPNLGRPGSDSAALVSLLEGSGSEGGSGAMPAPRAPGGPSLERSRGPRRPLQATRRTSRSVRPDLPGPDVPCKKGPCGAPGGEKRAAQGLLLSTPVDRTVCITQPLRVPAHCPQDHPPTAWRTINPGGSKCQLLSGCNGTRPEMSPGYLQLLPHPPEPGLLHPQFLLHPSSSCTARTSSLAPLLHLVSCTHSSSCISLQTAKRSLGKERIGTD